MVGFVIVLLIAGGLYLFVSSKLKSHGRGEDREKLLKSELGEPDFLDRARIYPTAYALASQGSHEGTGINIVIGTYRDNGLIGIVIENKKNESVIYRIEAAQVVELRVEQHAEQSLGPYARYEVNAIGLKIDSDTFPWKEAFIVPERFYLPPMYNALSEALSAGKAA